MTIINTDKYMRTKTKARSIATAILIVPMLLTLASSCSDSGKTPKLETTEDTLSWAMGENIALNLMSNNVIKLDNDIVLQAIQHTMDGKEQPLPDSTYTQAVQFFNMVLQNKQLETAANSKNQVTKQEIQRLNEIKASNPNIKEHPSGFLYEVLKEGKGPKAKMAQRILFDYRSYLLLTGEPYDQTYGKRPPIMHVVGEPMFPGLIEGLQLMNAGSIYRFYFPYELAFGEQGAGPIPGYTPFIYEIELHELYEN